jgi:hypothetical protein
MDRLAQSSKDPGFLADCTMACRDSGSGGRVVAVAIICCFLARQKGTILDVTTPLD